MDDRKGLRDEPDFERIPYSDYLALIRKLLTLSATAIAALWLIQHWHGSGFFYYAFSIMAWSLFGFTGLLLTDLLPTYRGHSVSGVHSRR